MLPLLTEWSRDMGGRLPDGRPLGVMHYFSGGRRRLRARYIELGFLISIHTSVTHPKATQLQEVARATPLEHLVIETDSPYGAPQRYRGKRNEPAYVAEAAAKVAELKGIAVEEVASARRATPMRLLGLHGRERHAERAASMKVATSIYGPVAGRPAPRRGDARQHQARRDFPALSKMLGHVLGGGGKRLRPGDRAARRQVRRLRPRPARAARRVDRAAAHGHARPRRRHRRLAVAPRARRPRTRCSTTPHR